MYVLMFLSGHKQESTLLYGCWVKQHHPTSPYPNDKVGQKVAFCSLLRNIYSGWQPLEQHISFHFFLGPTATVDILVMCILNKTCKKHAVGLDRIWIKNGLTLGCNLWFWLNYNLDYIKKVLLSHGFALYLLYKVLKPSFTVSMVFRGVNCLACIQH